MKAGKYDYEALKAVIAKLRAPDGCPWDREQTHQSLKRYLIEETYETLEAIDAGDPDKVCDELGDVLLQVVLHAQIASEAGQFTMDDVVHGVAAKMVARHRHVFGDAEAATAADVLTLWDDIKKEEKGHVTHTQSLKDVPPHLPALMRGYKVQHKAAKAGFDWDHMDGAWQKVREEMAELEEAAVAGDRAHMEEELGDLLFAVVNVSRFMDIQPELALTGTIEKFIRRFSGVEDLAREDGNRLEDMSLAEMDALWEKVKGIERKTGT
jgi:tetrapyrrole methylase family protein/MazG family protein